MSVERVLIMAAGTGGHVFPALAIARQLEAHGVKVDWLGTPNGMENRLLEGSGIPVHTIDAKGLKGKGLSRLLGAPWMLMRSLWQSLAILRAVQPDCVLGMGGYVSGPGGLAAKLLGRRLVLHEQNAVAGLSNRALALLAEDVLEAFPDTFKAGPRVLAVGNPVRADIEALGDTLPALAPASRPLRLLVLGGSQGAQAINRVLPAALSRMQQQAGSMPEVRHQTGAAQLDDALAAYSDAGVEIGANLSVSAFIDDMAAAYAWADLVLCRSGASTVSELAVAGRPSLLVPYPYHKDQQQHHNARWLSAVGGAIVIEQAALESAQLAAQLLALDTGREALHAMALAAHTRAQRGVDVRIAALLRGKGDAR